MNCKSQQVYEYVAQNMNATLNDSFMAGWEAAQAELLKKLDEIAFLRPQERRLMIDIVNELGDREIDTNE